MFRIFLSTTFFLVFFCALSASAQTQPKNGSSDNLFKEKPFDKGATYGDPEAEKSSKKKKRRKKKGHGIDYEEKQKEFEKRMKENAKKYKKMQKEMEKPQYSDPTYFGHKKKPKKRKPGKKKFCKECGLTH